MLRITNPPPTSAISPVSPVSPVSPATPASGNHPGPGSAPRHAEPRRESSGSGRDEETPGDSHALMILPWITEEFRFHSVLEMGCGSGAAVTALREAAYEAHGIELRPGPSPAPGVREGDMFASGWENGYFDLVLCTNVLQDVEDARVPMLLSEVDRLSNSYVMLTMPSGEKDLPGTIRSARWWCDRISDLGWRLRILREDSETGLMAILAEKRDSLAAKVLPLLDAAKAAGDAPASAGDRGTQRAVEIVHDILGHFARRDPQAAYEHIAELADELLNAGSPPAHLTPTLKEIVGAMERGDAAQVEILVRDRLLPSIENGSDS